VLGRGVKPRARCRTPAAPTRAASLPTAVKEVLTLLVHSKTRGPTVLPTAFEGQSDRVHASGDSHAHGVGDRSPQLHPQRQSWPCLHWGKNAVILVTCILPIRGTSRGGPTCLQRSTQQRNRP
jgi:hypothetical protein